MPSGFSVSILNPQCDKWSQLGITHRVVCEENNQDIIMNNKAANDKIPQYIINQKHLS